MRARIRIAVLAVAAVACGGGDRQAEPPRQTEQTRPPAATPTPPPAARPAPARPAPTTPPTGGRVVEIRMTGNNRDRAAFEPNRLTVAPGTTLRFINASGGPHSIAFWGDSIPRGSRDLLNSAMPRHMGQLMSLMLTAANETYDITIPTNIPKGVYKGYCPPHLQQRMTFAVTVR
jgi:plastocyanin